MADGIPDIVKGFTESPSWKQADADGRRGMVRELAVAAQADGVPADELNPLLTSLYDKASDGGAAAWVGRAVKETALSIPAGFMAAGGALTDAVGLTDTGSGGRLAAGFRDLQGSIGQRFKSLAPNDNQQQRDKAFAAFREDLDKGAYPPEFEAWLAQPNPPMGKVREVQQPDGSLAHVAEDGDVAGWEKATGAGRQWFEQWQQVLTMAAGAADLGDDMRGNMDWVQQQQKRGRGVFHPSMMELVTDYAATKDPGVWSAFQSIGAETQDEAVVREKLAESGAGGTDLLSRSLQFQTSTPDMLTFAMLPLKGLTAWRAARGAAPAGVGRAVASATGAEALQEGATETFTGGGRASGEQILEAGAMGAVGGGVLTGAAAGLGKLLPGKPAAEAPASPAPVPAPGAAPADAGGAAPAVPVTPEERLTATRLPGLLESLAIEAEEEVGDAETGEEDAETRREGDAETGTVETPAPAIAPPDTLTPAQNVAEAMRGGLGSLPNVPAEEEQAVDVTPDALAQAMGRLAPPAQNDETRMTTPEGAQPLPGVPEESGPAAPMAQQQEVATSTAPGPTPAALAETNKPPQTITGSNAHTGAEMPVPGESPGGATPLSASPLSASASPAPPPQIQTGTATSPPVPDTLETIAEQIRLAADPASARKVVLITPTADGSRNAVPPHKGLKEFEGNTNGHGRVFYNPDKITPKEIRKAAAGKVFDARVLGMTMPTDAPAGTKAVTASTRKAKNVQAQVISSDAEIPAAIAAAQAAAPGARVEVKPAAQVLEERMDGQPVKFSRPGRPAPSLQDARAAVAGLPEEIRRNVRVVRDHRDLNQADYTPGQWRALSSGDVQGFFQKSTGQTIVMAGNIVPRPGESGTAAVVRIVLHEQVAHRGLDALLASDPQAARAWQRLMQEIPTEELLALANVYPELRGDRAALAEEWLARHAEQMKAAPEGSLLRRIYEALVRFLRRVYRNVTGQRPPMDVQVRELLEASRRALRQQRAAAAQGPDLMYSVNATVAPVRVDSMKQMDKAEMAKRSSSAKFVHMQTIMDDVAAAYGVKIEGRQPIIGGWVESGQMSLEVPEVVTFDTDDVPLAMEMAALVAMSAPELQKGALIWKDDANGADVMVQFTAASTAGAMEVARDLNAAGVNGFSFDPSTRQFSLVTKGISDEDAALIHEFIKDHTEQGSLSARRGVETRAGSAEFPGEGDYRKYLESARRRAESIPGKRGELARDVVSRAGRRLDRYENGLAIAEKARPAKAQMRRPGASASKIEQELRGRTFENIRALGRWLDARFLKRTGVPMYTVGDPASVKEAGSALAYDVLDGLSADGSGMGWYDERVQETIRELVKIHPDFADNPTTLAVYIGILASTSQGYTVVQNFAQAERVFAIYKATGRLPSNLDFAKSSAPINENLRTIQELIDKYGLEGYAEFMDAEVTGKALRDQYGMQPTGVTLGEVVRGNRVLGPKIGSFFNNLKGRFDTITMDLWYTRTMHRYLGAALVPLGTEKMNKALQNFRHQITRRGARTYGVDLSKLKTDEDVITAAMKVFAGWSSGNAGYSEKGYHKFSDGCKVEKAARTLHAIAGMKGAPQNKAHRLWFAEVVREGQRKLKSMGFDLSAADIQAIIWYREKNLFARTGVANNAAKPADYLDAVMTVRNKQGLTVDETDAENEMEEEMAAEADGPAQDDIRFSRAEYPPLPEDPELGVRQFGERVPDNERLRESYRSVFVPGTYEKFTFEAIERMAREAVQRMGLDGALTFWRTQGPQLKGHERMALSMALSYGFDARANDMDKAGNADARDADTAVLDEIIRAVEVESTRHAQTLSSMRMWYGLSPQAVTGKARRTWAEAREEEMPADTGKTAGALRADVEAAVKADTEREEADHEAAARRTAENWIKRLSTSQSDTLSWRKKSVLSELERLLRTHLRKADPDFTAKAEALGVPPADVALLDKLVAEEHRRAAGIRRESDGEKLIKRLTAEAPVRTRDKMPDFIRDLMRAQAAGVLTRASFLDAYAKHYDRKRWDADFARELGNLARAVQAAPAGSWMRHKAQNALMTRMARWDGIPAHRWLQSHWYASILSGFGTQAVNLTGNASHVFLRTVQVLGTRPQHIMPFLRGMLRGAKEGARIGWQAMRNGDPVMTGADQWQKEDVLEVLWQTPGSDLNFMGKLGKYGAASLGRWVFRALTAADALFYNTAAEGKAWAMLAAAGGDVVKAAGMDAASMTAHRTQAHAELTAAGQPETQQNVQRRAYELAMASRDAVAQETARRFGARSTYNYDPEGSMGAVVDMLSALHQHFQKKGGKSAQAADMGVRFVVPFVRIVANIMDVNMDWSPVGMLRAAKGSNLTGGEKWTAQERQERLVAGIVSTAVYAGLYAMFSGDDGDDDRIGFMIYGQGPQDANARAQMPRGWKPNSIKVGSTYVSYESTPLAFTLAALGSALDHQRYGNARRQNPVDRLGAALTAGGKAMLNSGALSSLNGIFEMMEGRRHPHQWAERTAAGFLPAAGLMKDVATFMDPQKVDGSRLGATFLSYLPVARGMQEPQLNVFGEPVKEPGPWIVQRIVRTQDRTDPEAVWLQQNGLRIPGLENDVVAGQWLTRADKRWLPAESLARTVNGFLTPQERTELIRTTGPKIRQAIRLHAGRAAAGRPVDQDDINESVKVIRRSGMRQLLK